jgi:hypothetical protein
MKGGAQVAKQTPSANAEIKIRKEQTNMPEYAILRFEKHRGGAGGSIEAHHERIKESYASNPDIDTSRSNRNFHIIEEKRD